MMDCLRKLFRWRRKPTQTESAVMALFEAHERQLDNSPVYHFDTGKWTIRGVEVDRQTAIAVGDSEKAVVDGCVAQVKQSLI